MKKLRLKLASKQMLSKEQMKSVHGGYGGDCPENWTPTIKCIYPNGQFAGWMYTFANAGCTYEPYWDTLCAGYHDGVPEPCTGNIAVGAVVSDQYTCICVSENPNPCY